jgi:hypothetical protein
MRKKINSYKEPIFLFTASSMRQAGILHWETENSQRNISMRRIVNGLKN